ncbi:hypothetical protein Cadr_000004679 [Camelus dromedarius]|uniref:Uncharacterized protein n=1 Tax=Camelus dromedarius TaxID=9838 RepID=A0A5N4ECI3_CAMDR|nr:hypothetical protein Cadr_000004679 [Camelus dromedarius]
MSWYPPPPKLPDGFLGLSIMAVSPDDSSLSSKLCELWTERLHLSATALSGAHFKVEHPTPTSRYRIEDVVALAPVTLWEATATDFA